MKKYSRVCAQIDLDAFLFNLEQLHHVIRGEETKIMAVIKSDGYGHGSIPLAHAMEDVPYLWGFGVATLDEASQLRKKEIANPILVLSCVFPDQYEKAIKNEIRLTVYTLEAAKELSQLATQLDMEVIIHIKIDTGMGRIGFLPTEESIRAIKEIAALPKLKIEGVYTHFARADEADKSFTRQQEEAFKFVKKRLLEEGIEPSMYHSSNSAGILDVPTAHMDLVRAGIAMYGIYPSSEVNKEEAKLKPIMSISSHVAHVKWVEEGLSISYGGTYTSKERIRVATIPVGYGDGYPRALSNKGWVLIHGQKAPILGRVCMDQFMVDVTNIEGVKFGDLVTLLGQDGQETIQIETLSDISGRFPYEFVCDIGKRIPRSYIRDGVVVEQVDHFR